MQRETERQRQRETERDREKERETERQRENDDKRSKLAPTAAVSGILSFSTQHTL